VGEGAVGIKSELRAVAESRRELDGKEARLRKALAILEPESQSNGAGPQRAARRARGASSRSRSNGAAGKKASRPTIEKLKQGIVKLGEQHPEGVPRAALRDETQLDSSELSRGIRELVSDGVWTEPMRGHYAVKQ
jgi:hypothetical protein